MPGMKGKTVRLSADLWEKLAAMAKETERSVNYEIIQAVSAHVLKVVPSVGEVVPSQYQSDTKVVPHPDPAPAHEQSTPDQKEKKKKKRKKPDRQELSSMMLGIAGRVVDKVNQLRPKKKNAAGFSPETYVAAVAKLLKLGFSEEDLLAVVHLKASECQRKNDWEWFKPATLFRSTKFAGKLDEAKAGVINGKGPVGQTGLPLSGGYQMTTKADWEEQTRKDAAKVDKLRKDVAAANRKPAAARKDSQ